jgi:hypothetical protein
MWVCFMSPHHGNRCIRIIKSHQEACQVIICYVTTTCGAGHLWEFFATSARPFWEIDVHRPPSPSVRVTLRLRCSWFVRNIGLKMGQRPRFPLHLNSSTYSPLLVENSWTQHMLFVVWLRKPKPSLSIVVRKLLQTRYWIEKHLKCYWSHEHIRGSWKRSSTFCCTSHHFCITYFIWRSRHDRQDVHFDRIW